MVSFWIKELVNKKYALCGRNRFLVAGRHGAGQPRRVRVGRAAAATLIVRGGPTVDWTRLVSGLKNWGTKETYFAENLDFWHSAGRRRRVRVVMAAAASLVVRESATVNFTRLVFGLKRS